MEVERYTSRTGTFTKASYAKECFMVSDALIGIANILTISLSLDLSIGKGRLTWKDGVVYTGDFKYNAMTGRGEYEWPDKSQYSGDLLAGLRHG